MPARLTLHFPRRPAQVFWLADGGEHLVGRDVASTIYVDDERVSRRHACLDRTGDDWDIVDLDSKNGTRVDGVEVTSRTALGDDAWLSLGGLLARFESVPDGVESLQRHHLQTSIELQRQLTPTLGLESLLERVLDSAIQASGADRGFVLLVGVDGSIEVRASRGIDTDALAEDRFQGSRGAVERTLESRRSVVTCDAREDTWLRSRASVVGEDIRALVSVPLIVGERLVGVIYADSTTPGSAFTELDVDILGALAHHAALAIAVVELDDRLDALLASLPSAPTAEMEEVVERLEHLRPSERWGDGASAGLPAGTLDEVWGGGGSREEGREA